MREHIRQKRMRGLDTLRGIGITGIVLYHLFPSVFPGGFLGVPLFFVLSGYLMFVTSDNSWTKGKFHVRHYYKRRILKILPPLFAMVMVVCCYMTLFHKNLLTGIRGEILSIFLGYDNWWQIQQNLSYFTKLANASPFTHLWFLAVEIQFYLLWPVLFLLYQKGSQTIGKGKMSLLFLGLALLSAGRMLFLYVPGEDPSRVYYGTDTMAFPLLLGIFLGAVRQQQSPQKHGSQNHKEAVYSLQTCPPDSPFCGNKILRLTKKQGTIALFAFFLVTVCILFVSVDGQDSFVYQGGMFLISLYFASMVYLLENYGKEIWNILDHSLMALVGKKSYLIYLWHYPIIILGTVVK